MQNFKYYVVITEDGEKRIFDKAKDYIIFKNKHWFDSNFKGFNNIEEAYEFLENHSYENTAHIDNIEWEHYDPVFTEPLNSDTDTHADIYVMSTYKKEGHIEGEFDFAYSTIIRSDQYKNTYQTVQVEHFAPGTKKVTSYNVVVNAARIAYDNGFKSITIYTNNKGVEKHFYGKYQAKSESSIRYLIEMFDLVLNKHMEIKIEYIATDDIDNMPKECFAAIILNRYALDNKSLINPKLDE